MQTQESYKNLLKFGLSVVIWGCNTMIWAWFWMQHYADIILRPFGYKGNWLVFVVYGILSLVFTSFYGGYQIGYYRRGDVTLSALLALAFTNGITYLQTCLVGRGLMAPTPFLIMSAVQGIAIILWAIGANKLYISIFPPRKMLLIYGGSRQAKSLIQKMLCRSEKYVIQEVVSAEEGYEAICRKAQGFGSVILCDLPPKFRNMLLKYCFERSIRTYTTPKISDILIRGGVNITLFDTPLLLNRNLGLSFEQRLLKRCVDIVFSFVGIVLTLPLMLTCAIAVKACDRGPVFFTQNRCTIHNKVFRIYKFRSMIVNAEAKGQTKPATDNDSRITPVGRILRTSRLDELPQLFNILKGDMSIVGPRPERIEHVQAYTEEIPEFAYRSKVKGGLTGYAQVMGRYNTSAYDKLKMDLMYIAGYSLMQDFKLMLMTFKIIFVKSSTSGFEVIQQPQTQEELDGRNI